MEKKECRYCLQEDQITNLITPCHCEGTMKYVHNECLEDWIKNSNRTIIQEPNLINKSVVYSTKCEICKFTMKYTTGYMHSWISSFFKMIKSVFTNTNNFITFCFHSIIIYFVVIRLRLFLIDLRNLIRKRFKFEQLFKFGHHFTVLMSIIAGIIDIYTFYTKLFVEKRKSYIKFLSYN